MLRIGSRRFAPRPWAVLLYLCVVIAMLALGRWQLERADEKTALRESAARARALPAVALERVDDTAAAARAHRRVLVRGRWVEERQLLWDNRAHGGRAGYEVITPLRLVDGRLALVNRGWIAPGATRARESLPDVSLPREANAAPVELEGLLSRPSKGFAGGEALPEDGPWPRILQYFDYAAIADALGEPIVEAVVQAQVASDSEVYAGARSASGAMSGAGADTGRAGVGRAELLTPNWRAAASGPEKHFGYAFQWFAMAAALTVIFVVVNLSRDDKV